jgi:hypothetical protein
MSSLSTHLVNSSQVDTECTEFARSFTEKKLMRFGPAWFPRLCQTAAWPSGPRKQASRTVVEDRYRSYLRETPCELSALRVHLIGSSVP